MHAGDVLTLGRLAATPLFVWSFLDALAVSGASWLPAIVFAAVCASDYFDGILARRAGRASARGRVLDSLADVIFILAALGAAWVSALVPLWVPAAVAASFSYYVADSWLLTRNHTQRNLIASRLGHIGGVCNYALVGVLTFNNAGGLHWLSPAPLGLLFYLVPLYSGAAVLARLGFWRRPRTTRVPAA